MTKHPWQECCKSDVNESSHGGYIESNNDTTMTSDMSSSSAPTQGAGEQSLSPFEGASTSKVGTSSSLHMSKAPRDVANDEDATIERSFNKFGYYYPNAGLLTYYPDDVKTSLDIINYKQTSKQRDAESS